MTTVTTNTFSATFNAKFTGLIQHINPHDLESLELDLPYVISVLSVEDENKTGKYADINMQIKFANYQPLKFKVTYDTRLSPPIYTSSQFTDISTMLMDINDRLPPPAKATLAIITSQSIQRHIKQIAYDTNHAYREYVRTGKLQNIKNALPV